MDYSQFLTSFLQPFWWVILIASIAGLLKSPWGKGILGEILVKFIAIIRLDKNLYHRIHNITLPTPDGTTQIDHIFVSIYGITVPTITFDGLDDSVLPASGSASHRHFFTGHYEHRTLPDVGHNLPQEAPHKFANAVLSLM